MTINSADDSIPPHTYTREIGDAEGKLELPLSGEADQRYDLYVSAATADGTTSESVRLDVGP